MKIHYMSDLHFEFSEIMPQQADKVLRGGDVLVLAGDIIPIKRLGHARYLDHFLKTGVTRYKRVYAVAGNHEYYGRDLLDVDELERYYRQRGVKFLDNSYEDFGGHRIFGGVLWPDMNRNDPETKRIVEGYLNDYRVIGGLDPDIAVERHHHTMSLLREAKPDIVITHMAPSRGSVHPRYEEEGLANHGFFSEVEIPEHVKLWIHGHTHTAFDYRVGPTRIVCNPRGYPGERGTGFDFNAMVEM